MKKEVIPMEFENLGPEKKAESQLEKAEANAKEKEKEKPLDLDGQLTSIEGSLASTQSEIQRLSASLEKGNGDLALIRNNLGIENPKGEKTFEEQENEEKLRQLREQEAELLEEKEQVEIVQELNVIFLQMVQLKKLAPDELRFVIENGTRSDGTEFESKSGKVDPRIVRSMAEAAESGAEQLTASILKIFMKVVEGMVKAIFIAVKAVVGAAAALSGSSESSSNNGESPVALENGTPLAIEDKK